ncbi:MAG TPA: type II toxin-antitoxin system VapC family toxin [Stellaceae bacterium]|nr:type II toxin-antitoxin system VapC family toxin [Stellaceae bacterium]
MPFVIDASIVHAWAFDERHPTATRVRRLLDSDRAYAPSLWWFEVRNGLIMAERRGRLTEHETVRFLQDLSRLAIEMDPAPDESRALALARRHRLTVYDAAYLELAARERLPLATLDRALADAARAEGVGLLSDAPA